MKLKLVRNGLESSMILVAPLTASINEFLLENIEHYDISGKSQK